MKANTNNTLAGVTGLIVPISLAAFCVGEIDEQQATNSFAGATVVYTEQVTTKTQAFLGANVTRDFSAPPWNQLAKGIHLHWALPDAFTRGTVNEAGNLEFRAAPNRWLVTRLVILGDTPATKSWIIESDTLSLTPPSGQQAVTLPVKTAAAGQDYRYLGKWQEFDQSWHEPLAPPGETIKELTDCELTAVTNGVTSFAAYYPDCNTVFGFHDQLNDAQISANCPANLQYVVTGWFHTAANDPLSTKPELPDIQHNYNWTFQAGSEQPSYTVYNGIIQDIAWDPKQLYIYRQPAQLPLQAEIAIGNNPAEALAAYFRDKNHPDVPFVEKLLSAFQLGLLNTFTQPTAGQLAQMEELLHEKEFATHYAGNIFTIVKNDAPQLEVIDLPLQLANDLNLLNTYQQQYDLAIAQASNFRWQLFADWYRIFAASDPTTQNTAFNRAYNQLSQKWTSLQAAVTTIQQQRSDQLQVVTSQLAGSLSLKEIPAPRYWQPNEPTILLAGDELVPPKRYGGDGRYTPEGYLVCRLTNQCITEITVNGNKMPIERFSNVALPVPNGLPYPAVVNELLAEACLLNTRLIASITGSSRDLLQQALLAAVTDKNQTVYIFTGSTPSPVGLNWWQNNPWLPLFVEWSVAFHPLQPTTADDKLVNYQTDFFTGNYEIDGDSGGFIRYAPDGSPQSIMINPTTIDFKQAYGGTAILTAGAAENFARQLAEYLPAHPDATLQAIQQQLDETNILTQSLSGFSNALLMRRQSLQLKIQVPRKSHYNQLTQSIAAAVADANSLMPEFNGFFNPIRAGYMKLSLQVVDVFGQKRPVDADRLICAESLTAYHQRQAVPATVCLPPRIAQPSRLSFRWLAANSTCLDEMNAHPATSPVCGWLLPNHLDGSIFLYDEQGKPLGTLSLNSDQTQVLWQSAPGDNHTINQSVATVLQYANPQLRALAVKLQNGTADFFIAFRQAIDTAHASINPPNFSASGAMAVLIGRPVALVQAALRLEVQGSPAINQSWQCFTSDGYQETDNGFTGVQFPVILGDLAKLSDGLIGYFKQPANDDDYDLNTFYTEAAGHAATPGVVQPVKTTLMLTATPKLDQQQKSLQFDAARQKVLMLVDPCARIHATMGILPTKSIDIPPDQYIDTLRSLEMTFLTTPVLKGNGGLMLPVPQENGFQLSWIEADKLSSGAGEWRVTPDIGSPTGKAVWEYTPQQLVEGWLRLNPQLLEFHLLDAAGHAVVTTGGANSLTLRVKNKKGKSITFNPGEILPAGATNSGAIFFIHFGNLINQADVPRISIIANDPASVWKFQSLSNPKYGNYWAATPQGQPVTLANDEAISFTINNLWVASGIKQFQAQVYYDYYNIDGLSDGVYQDLLTIKS